MKYLAMTAAALFLVAAPISAFAQSSDNNSAGSNAGANANGNGGDNQCSDETATSSYGSFSEKCRTQIDAWAMSQSGKSSKVEGDVMVGTMVPDSVEIVDVPVYRNYGYVMLNDHRVLVDRTTHKVIKVY